MATVQPQVQQRHPVTLKFEAARANKLQLRIADAITAFAGSMAFVYIHVLGFAAWMLFVEASPWPTLTLVVSLEAIFLSTFVMIGQNRQARFQEVKADHEFNEEELQLNLNTKLTREIHQLVTAMHAAQSTLAHPAGEADGDARSRGDETGR